MKLKTLVPCAALLVMCGGTGMMAAAPAPDLRPGVPSNPGYGFAEAQVYHSVTSEPLARMPVHVIRIDLPETDDSDAPRVFITDENGIAPLGPLPHGEYMAYVSWNNNQSDPAFFAINGSTDNVPTIALFFNPDID